VLLENALGRLLWLHMIREDTPALVLLDLGLPDGKGHDVLKRVRQHSTLPISILTAQGELSSKVERFWQAKCSVTHGTLYC